MAGEPGRLLFGFPEEDAADVELRPRERTEFSFESLPVRVSEGIGGCGFSFLITKAGVTEIGPSPGNAEAPGGHEGPELGEKMEGLIRGCCFELSLRLRAAGWDEDEPVAAPRSLRTPFITSKVR